MMKLNTIELAKLLPLFMQKDSTFQGFCYAIGQEIKTLHEKTALIQIYKNIDTVDETILDELAWQFNVLEYNKDYSIDIKRDLIKNCLITHRKRGTVATVEEVATKIFGNATVEEWFEYDGEPYHFKVYTSNVSTSDEMINEFNRVVRVTQNIRSHLESVIAETMDSMDLYFGGFVQSQDDMKLETVDFRDYGVSAIELQISDGLLGYNAVAIQEQSLVFTDVSTGESYMLMYVDDSIYLDKGVFADSVEYLQLTDPTTNKNYKVFVDNGILYYESIE